MSNVASNGSHEPIPEVVNNKNSLLFQLVAMNIIRKQSLRGVPWNQLKSENIETLYLLSAGRV